MCLPIMDNRVDEPQFYRMMVYFIEESFNYFDAAHGYIRGQSETAICSCLINIEKFIDVRYTSVNLFYRCMI